MTIWRLSQAFHDDLSGRRSAVSDAISRCSRLLQETTSAEADDIRARLTTISDQADLVLRLSAERLAALEDALPIATHFAATLNDLRAWLSEISAETRSIDVPHSANSEQLQKLLEAAKVLYSSTFTSHFGNY